MPAKSGKGATQLKQKYAQTVGRMTGPRTESAMAKVLSIGITGAKELAPMEYGTLINSAYRRINKTAAGTQGVAGFTVNYAIYLHQDTTWKPRPVGMKKGPAWNPNAESGFLRKGFTNPDQIALMRRALGSEYKL